MSFSEKLQKLRKFNKLSQEQLADMLDVTRQSVSKWESGSTYPEMDKLLSMCKIFKCSLEDLTNEEITDITIENKKKNNINNFIDSFFEMIKKTYEMFRSMSFKQIIKCFITMFIIGLILCLFHLPFEGLKNALYVIVSSINNESVVLFISGIINLLIDLCYYLLYLLVFIYLFKIIYLDNHQKKEVTQKDNQIKEVKVVSTNPILNGLATIVIVIIKTLICLFSIPFVMSLFGLSMGLLITIGLLFKGVFYIGILLGLVFALTLNILIIEIVINLLFNHQNKVKRLLITFVISITGLGLSTGILMFEIANTTYINESPIKETTTLNKEISMNDNLLIDTYYQPKYVVDNSMENIKVVVEYYKDYTNPLIESNGDIISIHHTDMDKIVVKNLTETIINDLKAKQIHNYNELNNFKITIYGSKENIEKLKQKKREQIDNQEVDNLYQQIDNLEQEKNNLENENYELKAKIEEHENKINDYEESLKALLERN